MSSARTSSEPEQTKLPASPVTTASSSVSIVSLPGPTHTPSQTPVIAGSLVGVIVLVVCLVTLLLLHKRRLRLRAERILRATQQYSNSPNFPARPLHKPRSLNGYEGQPPPRTQDSASSSGSSAPSPSGVSPFSHTSPHLPHDNSPPDSTRQRHRPPSSNRSIRDPQDHHQPLAPSSIPIHPLAQSSSSGGRSQKPPLSPSQPHRTTMSVRRTQTPVNVPQMTLESSAPHGHTDEAVVDIALVNNNLVSASPSAIFGNTNRSDAGERTVTRQGFDGSKAGVSIIAATGEVERVDRARRGGFEGSREPDRGVVGELWPIASNGVEIEARNAHGNEGGRSGTPDPPSGYGHLQGHTQGGEEDHVDGRQRVEMPKTYASVSESEYSYLPAGTGSGSIEGAPKSRIGDPDRVESAPDSAVSSDSITAAMSGSSSSDIPTSVLSSSPSPHHPNVTAQYSQPRNYANQKTTADANNTQLVPSARRGQNRSYLGHNHAPIALSRLGAGSSVIEEDAPPAYENAWASAREGAPERTQAERVEPRTP